MRRSETETVLKNAVIEMHRKELGLLPEKAVLRKQYVPLSKDFYEKIKKLLGMMRRKHQRELWANVAAAIFVVIVTIFLFTTPGSISRAKDKIIETFEHYFAISFGESDETIVEHELRYVPEGYVLEYEFYDGVMRGNQSYTDGENYMEFHYAESGSNQLISNEGVELQALTDEDGKEMYYAPSNEGSQAYLIWEREGLSYMLMGNLELEELTKMKDSIFRYEETKLYNPYKISDLPQGYKLEKSVLGELEGFEWYVNSAEEQRIELIYSGEWKTVDVDAADAAVERISDGEKEIYYLEYRDEPKHVLIWEEDGITFTMISQLEKDEMMQMKESVKEVGFFEGLFR